MRPGFLGVIDEISLPVPVRVAADDLDAVLVGADGAVCAQPVEHGPHYVIGLDVERVVDLDEN